MGPGWLYGLLIALSIAVASPSAARAAYCQATETACLGGGGAVDLNRREVRDGVAASFGVIERGPDHQGRSCRPRHVAWSRIVELATGRITHLAVDYAFHFHNNYQYFVASVYLWHRHAVGGGGWSGWTPVQIRYGVFGFRDGDGSATHLLPLSLPAGSRVQVKLSLYMNHRSTYHSYYYGHGYPSFGPGWLRIDKVVGYFHYQAACLRRRETQTCREDRYEDARCAPLKDTPACSMLSSVCRAADKDGRCGAYADTYRCSPDFAAPTAGVVDLGDSYTIAKDALDGGCSQQEAAKICRRTGETCVEGAETRTIGGLPVHKDCWKWKRTYACDAGTRISTCDALAAEPRCVRRGAVCLSPGPNGGCAHRETSYLCGAAAAAPSTTLACGKQTYCLNGDCEELSYEPSADLPMAAAWIRVLFQAAEDFDAPDQIFKGTAETCTVNPMSFNNCCADSGWGQDIGLAQCDEEERALIEKVKAKLVVHVGTYCEHKTVLGVCLAKTRAYCAFRSRIGRLIQQQGRPQLGLSWGPAESPDCAGLTPEQLQQIDFSAIDLGEIADDMARSVQAPDKVKTRERMMQRIKDYYQRMTPGGGPP